MNIPEVTAHLITGGLPYISFGGYKTAETDYMTLEKCNITVAQQMIKGLVVFRKCRKSNYVNQRLVFSG